MSFVTGFAAGVFQGLDTGLQKSEKRRKDFQDDLIKIGFEKQIDEKEEWDDEVELAKKAIERGASVFKLADGSIDPQGTALAAAALKRSGSISDYNNFITELKKSTAAGNINPRDYFAQLPTDFQIGSAKDYARAFVGPMHDYTNIPIPEQKGGASKLLEAILGKKINTSQQVQDKLNAKLAAFGIKSDFESGTNAVLPHIQFFDYKFNIDSLPPQERLVKMKEMLLDPIVQKDADKVSYLKEKEQTTLQTIKEQGNRLERMSANDFLISNLITQNNKIEDESVIASNNEQIEELRAENAEIKLDIALSEARKNILNEPLGVINIEEKVLLSKLTQLQLEEGVDNTNEIIKVQTELNNLRDGKLEIGIGLERTFQGKINLMNEYIQARITQDENYKDTAEHKADLKMKYSFENELAQLQISGTGVEKLDAALVGNWQNSADEYAEKAIMNTLWSNFIQFKQIHPDGSGSMVFKQGKEGQVIDGEPVTKANYEAALTKFKKLYYDMQMFRIGQQPELFAAATGFYNSKGLGKITKKQMENAFGWTGLVEGPNFESEGSKVLSKSRAEDEQIVIDGLSKKYPPTIDGMKKIITDSNKKLSKDNKTVQKKDILNFIQKVYPNTQLPPDVLTYIDTYFEKQGAGKGPGPTTTASASLLKKFTSTQQSPAQQTTSTTNIPKLNWWQSGQSAIANRYSNDFVLAKDESTKKNIVEQAVNTLMHYHKKMTRADALALLKSQWNAGGTSKLNKYFASGGLMSRQSS